MFEAGNVPPAHEASVSFQFPLVTPKVGSGRRDAKISFKNVRTNAAPSTCQPQVTTVMKTEGKESSSESETSEVVKPEEVKPTLKIVRRLKNKGQSQHRAPIVIPRSDLITAEELLQRKYLNINRWNCVSRPQYAKSCGISSLVACWNYLFTTLGNQGGKKNVLTQEAALDILGFKAPFDEIKFGSFTGNK